MPFVDFVVCSFIQTFIRSFIHLLTCCRAVYLVVIWSALHSLVLARRWSSCFQSSCSAWSRRNVCHLSATKVLTALSSVRRSVSFCWSDVLRNVSFLSMRSMFSVCFYNFLLLRTYRAVLDKCICVLIVCRNSNLCKYFNMIVNILCLLNHSLEWDKCVINWWTFA